MRFDNFLVKYGFFDSRTKAKQAIERGEMFVCGKVLAKPSYDINEQLFTDNLIKIERVCEKSFVSIGGFKMDKALVDFDFSVKGFTCADIGASTGGFTDCLLKNGAKKVYAIDLNDDLLHYSLKDDDRVIPIIKNAKLLTKTDFNNENPDLFACDLSFISATQILPTIANLAIEGAFLILLIKPQFETGEKRRFKNGIIRDDKIRKKACENVLLCAKENSFTTVNITTAPIKDNKNIEYLVLLKKN
jgi:23S rRNA (cytidine1920-2'-O)/16S rRNA (cytidine1409-2'-O)-methyltransferase